MTATVSLSAAVVAIDASVSAVVQAPYGDLNTANNSVTDSDTLLGELVFANGFE